MDHCIVMMPMIMTFMVLMIKKMLCVITGFKNENMIQMYDRNVVTRRCNRRGSLCTDL